MLGSRATMLQCTLRAERMAGPRRAVVSVSAVEVAFWDTFGAGKVGERGGEGVKTSGLQGCARDAWRGYAGVPGAPW